MTTPEVHRLHPLSWLFITGNTVKRLVIPAILVLFASSTNPLARYELLSLIAIGPALVVALFKQAIYSYRFAADELVIREGFLFRKERHIPYGRVHNVALVRNPFHRMLGVASARVETAAGGEPEAVMRVLSLAAVGELRRHALGKERAAALPAAADAEAPPELATVKEAASSGILLRVPAGELVRLGLISNRGFLVVAAFVGVVSQASWWELDWEAYYGAARDRAPEWSAWLFEPGSTTSLGLIGVGLLLLLFVVLLRVFSVAWHLTKYYGFVLARDDDDLRAEFGLLTRVSSLIPVHRIQLVTMSASLLHRWSGRAGIDVETAGAMEGSGEDGDQLAGMGSRSNRQWLAPIIAADRAPALIRAVIPEIDVEAVDWEPLDPRAVRRIFKKALLALGAVTGLVTAILALTPIPVSPWHALWLPALLAPLIWRGADGWVQNAGWALTDDAVFFRSGWLARRTSVVRFDKMQTVTMRESPLDRRNHMASVAVDTAGAGSEGHRIAIPYLDLEVARGIFERLYGETCGTEFNW